MGAISGGQLKSMAVASKSAVSARKQQIPSKVRAVGDLNSGVVPLQLKAQSAPLWLLRLCALQRRFCVITFLLMAGMLTVYAWTAYSQQRWSQAYRKLETLQRHERQLTATSEVLKNHMALQAEQPATGLVPPNPATAIFVVPAPQRPARTPESVVPATKAAAQTKSVPLSY